MSLSERLLSSLFYILSPSLSLLRSSFRTKEIRDKDTPESRTRVEGTAYPTKESNTFFTPQPLFYDLYWTFWCGLHLLEEKSLRLPFQRYHPPDWMQLFQPMQIPTCKWAEFMALYVIWSLQGILRPLIHWNELHDGWYYCGWVLYLASSRPCSFFFFRHGYLDNACYIFLGEVAYLKQSNFLINFQFPTADFVHT